MSGRRSTLRDAQLTPSPTYEPAQINRDLSMIQMSDTSSIFSFQPNSQFTEKLQDANLKLHEIDSHIDQINKFVFDTE